tara:strand:+ start:38 stop:1759 length:1722 start_codon:yes stop_codon:yes gene_type:complete
VSIHSKRALEELRLVKKRLVRFSELSKYIKSYDFCLDVDAYLKNSELVLKIDLEFDLVYENNSNVRSVFKNSVVAYSAGRFDYDITPLMLIANDYAMPAFPFNEVACILIVFFVRKRKALGVPAGCSDHFFARCLACASGFMNSSHVLRGELLEIRENINPATRLANFFDNLIWHKPPINICLNEILYAFGHLGMLPLYWFYAYHISSNLDLQDPTLRRQAYSVFKNYFLQDSCAKVPSESLSFVVDKFMKDVDFASLDEEAEPTHELLFSEPANTLPVVGGGQYFYKGNYYHHAIFGSWLNYCADQSLSPRPNTRLYLHEHPAYRQSLFIKDYLHMQRELHYKRVVGVHIKDGSYKGHLQLSRLVPESCYEALFRSHKDTLFVIVGEKASEMKLSSAFSNVLSLGWLCDEYGCDRDIVQLLCLEWSDAYITSSSGNYVLAELFRTPSLLIGGLDTHSYSSFLTRMPSRTKLNGIPLTNSFFGDNISYVQYQYEAEYNGLPDCLDVDYLSPRDVLKAYSQYISLVDLWRKKSVDSSSPLGPFALPALSQHQTNPLQIHQASLSSALNRIDPWE